MTVSFFWATDENDEGSTVDWGVNKNQTFSFPFLLCLWCSQLLLHYREPTTVYISYNSTGQVHNCVVLSIATRERERNLKLSATWGRQVKNLTDVVVLFVGRGRFKSMSRRVWQTVWSDKVTAGWNQHSSCKYYLYYCARFINFVEWCICVLYLPMTLPNSKLPPIILS